MKKTIFLPLFLISILTFSQVGINTNNPQGTFHIDGNKDNPVAGTPNIAQQANDFVFTSTGQIGIGTITPTNKLEINSNISNTSGLKFSNLNSSTPVSAGATLGVDQSGNVVTVTGNAFAPASGRSVLTSTANIPANGFNYNLTSITLPTAGTYLITYSIRGEIQVTGGFGYLTGFLSTAPTAGNIVPNTEILIVTSADTNRNVIGGTGTGSLVTTVAGPTTYYAGIRSTTLAGIVFNNADGRTSMTYIKITP
ncbi:hypothetical protein [Chryseobacterium jejuense]|uniref:hypothetical protein n=1 Tax=Chryseobacterium jejuense TaxID=445960 RepID=UPI001AE26691|nr:hypothetical protein [Chryseobacterium jejuense]MBP2614936.1 hypothetical protein [Chryseobacterium jejuense]